MQLSDSIGVQEGPSHNAVLEMIKTAVLGSNGILLNKALKSIISIVLMVKSLPEKDT